MDIIHNTIDIIVKRNDVNILESQAINLVIYLPDWEIYEPFPNGGKAPAGSYTRLISPIFELNKDNLELEIQKTLSGLSKFISDLNNTGKGISRVDCTLEQSDDIDAVPHPNNGLSNTKYRDNKDYKNSSWVFSESIKSEDSFKDTVYLNKTFRETNDVKVTKKYYTLIIDSPWLSI